MCRCPDGRQGNLCQTGKCYNNPCLGRSVSILRDPSCVDVPTEDKEICVRPVSVNNPCLGRSVSILRDPLCVDVPMEDKEICVRPVSVITIRVSQCIDTTGSVSVNNPCLGRSVSILRDPLCVDVRTEGKEICVRPVSVITIRVWVAVYRYYGILRVQMSRRKTGKSVSDR